MFHKDLNVSLENEVEDNNIFLYCNLLKHGITDIF